MNLAILVPHLGYLKHFLHLFEYAIKNNTVLTVFYYQKKTAFTEAQYSNFPINFIKLNERNFIANGKMRTNFKLLNSLKNFIYWQQPELNKYTQLAYRFRLRPSFLEKLDSGSRALLQIIEDLQSKENNQRTIKAIIKRMKSDRLIGKEIESQLLSNKIEILFLSPFLDGDWEPIALNLICQRLGIRTVGYMASWDNFENKGLAQPSPDFFFCWSEHHKLILNRLHNIDLDKIYVVGSYIFNKWFSISKKYEPKNNAKNKKILYLCSSPFITGQKELEIVAKLAESLGQLKENQFKIEIRPHPQNFINFDVLRKYRSDNIKFEVNDFDIHRFDSVEERKAFSEKLRSYDCVIGVNTSLMLECCALGLPVISIDAQQMGVSIPDTGHVNFLKNFMISEFTNYSSIRNFFKNYNHERVAFLADDKSNSLKSALLPFDCDFKKNFENVINDLSKRPISSDKYEEFEVAKNYNFKITLANVKKGIRILKNDGLFEFYSHAKLFFDNKKIEKAYTPNQSLFQTLVMKTDNDFEFKILHIKNNRIKFTSEKSYTHYLDEFTKELCNEMKQYDKIIIGPWFSELGFELLYLIPYLNYLTQIDEQLVNLTIVSRGGEIPLYQSLNWDYINSLAHYSEDEWDSLLSENWKIVGGLKQSKFTHIDGEILNKVITENNLNNGRLVVVHPSIFFGIFSPFWRQDFHVKSIIPVLNFPKIASVEPENKRIFMKFYSRPSLADTVQTKLKIQTILKTLIDYQIDFCTRQAYKDDHELIKVDCSKFNNVKEFQANNFRENLRIQLELMVKCSTAMVTYGGLSYFPLFYGHRVIAFYDNKTQYSQKHLQLAQHLALYNNASFTMMDINLISDDFKSQLGF